MNSCGPRPRRSAGPGEGAGPRVRPRPDGAPRPKPGSRGECEPRRARRPPSLPVWSVTRAPCLGGSHPGPGHTGNYAAGRGRAASWSEHRWASSPARAEPCRSIRTSRAWPGPPGDGRRLCPQATSAGLGAQRFGIREVTWTFDPAHPNKRLVQPGQAGGGRRFVSRQLLRRDAGWHQRRRPERPLRGELGAGLRRWRSPPARCASSPSRRRPATLPWMRRPAPGAAPNTGGAALVRGCARFRLTSWRCEPRTPNGPGPGGGRCVTPWVQPWLPALWPRTLYQRVGMF